MSNKLTVFFQSEEGFGWSEDYNYAGSVATATLNTFVPQFANVRRAFMSLDCRIVWMRFGTPIKRFPNIYNLRGSDTGLGQKEGVQNNVNNSVLARMENETAGFNRIFMKGIPDELVSQNVFTPDALWLTRFNAFVAFITGGGNFNIVANVANPQTPLQVQSMAPNFPRGILITMQNANALDGVKKVRIQGATIIGYNGVKNVVRGPLDVDNKQYLLGGAAPQVAQPIGPIMSATPLVPKDVPVTTMFYEGFVERKAGRPFDLPRGRRPTVLPLRR